MSNYAGNEWLEPGIGVKEISPLGKNVADLLGDVFAGIYHLDYNALRKVDWSDKRCIQFVLGWHDLSTFDCDELTRLVVLCHDRMLRMSIEASTHKYLKLTFHCRNKRNGNQFERIPTIEQAIHRIRQCYA